ncbi:MAG TPA: S1 RNA-binding domain-containing protein [Thermoanaerobaculia bacterium]|nr:S1 RNA-binding domain-containing protein [Thermoanaerobaculia bacterium]
MNDQETQEKTEDFGSLENTEGSGSSAQAEDAGAPVQAEDSGSPVQAEDAGAPVQAEDAGSPAQAEDAGATEKPEDAGAPEKTEDFGQILAEFEQEAPAKRNDPAVGQKVSGSILSIGEEWVFVDLGAKSEGRIAAAELKDAEGNLTVKEGDTLEATVTGTDPETGALLLKRKAGGKGKRSQEVVPEIRRAAESGLPVEGLVTGLNKGGAEVQLYGMRAFCPLSQLDLRYVEDPQRFVGQKLMFKVNRLEEGNRGGRGPNIVLSRRQLLEEEQQSRASETREKLQIGAVLTGHVTSLTTYGAFIDLGGIEGMLHVSEIGHSRTAHPQDVFTVGQEVEVQVIKIEKGKDEKRPERISLSRRALESDPWNDAASRFPEGTETTGRVARTESFGAFIELTPGLEGLVHISEMGAGRRLNHAKEAVQPGQEVQVRVLAVDTARRRISLSIGAVGGGATADRSDRSERSDSGFTRGDRSSNRGDRGDRGGDRGGRGAREEYEPAGRGTSGSSVSSGAGFGSMADFFSRSKKG